MKSTSYAVKLLPDNAAGNIWGNRRPVWRGSKGLLESKFPQPIHGARFGKVYIQPVPLSALDAFVADQQKPISRPEAIRVILMRFFRSKGYLTRRS
jgi:hypothetical protein